MIEVKARESGGGSNDQKLGIARPWCKGAEISHEDVTRATSHTMFGTAWPAVFGEARVVPVAALLIDGVNESITESQGKDAVLVASASDLWQEVM